MPDRRRLPGAGALERERGYDVALRGSAGPHAVPPEVARAAADRLGRDGHR